VQILSELAVGKFVGRLHHAGVRLGFRRGAGDPGLSLALGGVGVTLRDLAMLYCGLANDGRVAPLRFLATSPAKNTVALMTARSAQEIRGILVGVGAPDGIPALRPRAVAYKTGTSYGFRDALAVGFSGHYTVAVWVGRTEGTPRPGAFGSNTAAPILFQIFDLLPPEPNLPAPALHFRTSDLLPRASGPLNPTRDHSPWRQGWPIRRKSLFRHRELASNSARQVIH
jgi:penicillin-binding protein 1C